MESNTQSRRTQRLVNVITLTLALSAVVGVARGAWAQPVGTLTQLPRPDACTQHGGDGINCRDGFGLNGANHVAVSPNGQSVYVAGLLDNAISIFSRDPASGALTQLPAPNGCVADSGDGVTCQDGLGLNGPAAIAVSPDNKHVYVASYARGITIFTRTPGTGALTQLPAPDGCVAEFGGGGSGCTDAYGPISPTSILVSPDGKFVYTLALNGNAIGVFARDKVTGKLTQLPAPQGCLAATGDGVTCKSAIAITKPRGFAISKNGKNLYVAGQDDDAIAIFQRNKTTGILNQLAAPNGCVALNGDGVTCMPATHLDGVADVVVGKNGKHVYVVSYYSDALTIFERNGSTGALTQLAGPDGCHDESGDGVTCTDAVALNGARAIEQSKNGRNLYVATGVSSGVAAFRRNKTTGRLEQLYFPNACTTATGDNVLCRPGLGLTGASAVAVTKNGKHVYVSSYTDDAVAAFTRKR